MYDGDRSVTRQSCNRMAARFGMDSGLDLEKLLTRLPIKMRAAIRLVELEGLSVREAAARSGMSSSAVKVSVHRASRRCRA